MSMSTHVIGFKPPDDIWKKMKAVWESCQEAGVEPPEKVSIFFDYEPPDEAGVEISERDLEKAGAIREYREEMRDGYEILIDKLPKDVKIIRVYNSY